MHTIKSDTRIFNAYKKQLIRTAGLAAPNALRFNCIQYVCSFPKIDPVEMAADLQNNGYIILFDDSSISLAENLANKKRVNTAAEKQEVAHG